MNEDQAPNRGLRLQQPLQPWLGQEIVKVLV